MMITLSLYSISLTVGKLFLINCNLIYKIHAHNTFFQFTFLSIINVQRSYSLHTKKLYNEWKSFIEMVVKIIAHQHYRKRNLC